MTLERLYNIKRFTKNETDNSYTGNLDSIDPNFDTRAPARELILWNDLNMTRAIFILNHIAEEEDKITFTYKSKYVSVPLENITVYLKKTL